MGDEKKTNRAKAVGVVLCMLSVLGCVAGAAANGSTQAIAISSSGLLFLVGLGAFVVGRLRE